MMILGVKHVALDVKHVARYLVVHLRASEPLSC